MFIQPKNAAFSSFPKNSENFELSRHLVSLQEHINT